MILAALLFISKNCQPKCFFFKAGIPSTMRASETHLPLSEQDRRGKPTL